MAQQEKSNIKPADIILLVLTVILSGLLLMGSLFLKESGNTVIIEIDGQEYSRYSLSDIKEDKTVEINTKYGSNTIVIQKDGVYVKTADCPDKTDVKKGKITKTGDSIVCIPNRLIIYIEGESDVDATSY